MTYLVAMQDVAFIVGVTPPLKIDDESTVAQRFRRMANRTGWEVARRADWQGLLRSVTFTGDGAITQWPLPDGYDRQVGGNPVMIEGTGEFLRGGVYDDEWRFLKGLGPSSVKAYRIQNNMFETLNPLGVGETALFDYVTYRWIVGSTTERFTTNDDTTVFPERLLVGGVVWRWRRAHGVPFDDELKEHEADLAAAAQADRSYRPPASMQAA